MKTRLIGSMATCPYCRNALRVRHKGPLSDKDRLQSVIEQNKVLRLQMKKQRNDFENQIKKQRNDLENQIQLLKVEKERIRQTATKDHRRLSKQVEELQKDLDFLTLKHKRKPKHQASCQTMIGMYEGASRLDQPMAECDTQRQARYTIVCDYSNKIKYTQKSVQLKKI